MKFHITILVFLMYSTTLFSQQRDDQWLIRDGKLKPSSVGAGNNINLSYDHVTSDFFKIQNLEGPSSPFEIDGATFTPRHKFFAIFSDGSYCIRRTESSVSNFSFLKSNPSPSRIKYLYLTNEYEGEEPPEMHLIDNVTTGASLITLGTDSGLVASIVNQEILDGDDIVFVLGDKNYKICCDIDAGIEFVPVGFESFSPNGNILFSDNGLQLGTKSFDDLGCLDLSSISSNGTSIDLSDNTSYKYLLFNVKVQNPTVRNVNFKITKNIGSRDEVKDSISHHKVPVVTLFHDPNFIELKCVWEENGDKWARYRVECYNSGKGEVDEVDFLITLPEACISDSVLLNNWQIGRSSNFSRNKSKGCGTSNLVSIELLNGEPFMSESFQELRNFRISNVESNSIKINFDIEAGMLEGMEKYPQENNIAWAEFCVKLKSNTNIYLDDLQPSNPRTVFMTKGKDSKAQKKEYPIVHYIDEQLTIPYGALSGVCDIMGNKTGLYSIRANTGKCGRCECQN